jgi:hypothetical protein
MGKARTCIAGYRGHGPLASRIYIAVNDMMTKYRLLATLEDESLAVLTAVCSFPSSVL